MRISSVLLILATSIALTNAKVSTDNVVMIIELTRHGARGPLNNVADTDWVNKYGAEELTPIGERQRFVLGMNTRARYPTVFFKNDYDKLTPEYMA